MNYTYSITQDIASAKVFVDRLSDEVVNSGLSGLQNIDVDADSLTLNFSSALTTEQQTSLNGIVAAHSGEPYTEVVDPTEVKIVEEVASAPFASKTLVTGQKLFKRVHGVFETVPANTTRTISLVVPYTQAKINALEIVGAVHGDTANFNVYDNAAGSISTVPNYKLNQFGFNVCLRKDFHTEMSQYDADVIVGMTLELEYTNTQNVDLKIGANFILHELKD